MSSTHKRPIPKPLQPNIKNVSSGSILYKGISNSARVYETPVFFTFSRNHAQTYAKARLGEYVTKKPLKLLHLTKRTLRYLMNHSNLAQINKNRLAFTMGLNMTVKSQIEFLNKITQNKDQKAFYEGIMRANISKTKTGMNTLGGRKSFMNIDLNMYKGLCAFCRQKGYDGIYVDELSSVFHPRFGAELVLCNPRNSLVNINFNLRNP
jgi:hypothetical protein